MGSTTFDRRSGRAFSGLLLASTVLAGGSAFAQEAAPAVSQANVIIVTSQRRSEDVQDVPISVQVLGNETLENLQIDSFEDYTKFLPSVSTQNLGGPASNLVFMRGVASGGDGNHSGPLPSVGTYLDEQPITTAQGPAFATPGAQPCRRSASRTATSISRRDSAIMACSLGSRSAKVRSKSPSHSPRPATAKARKALGLAELST